MLYYTRTEGVLMKFATIGTSWITESFIASARLLNNAEIYAAYSRSADKAKAFAETMCRYINPAE